MSIYVIHQYSHSFIIDTPSGHYGDMIGRYCSRLATYENVFDYKLKRKIRKVTAVYATRNSTENEYGFLNAELSSLMAYLYGQGVREDDFTTINHKAIEGDTIEATLQDGVQPRDDEQRKVMEFITTGKDRPSSVLGLRTGGGKAQPLYAKIRIPNAWCDMGDIAIDDTVVLPSGKTSTVTGVWPQGLRPTSRLTFADGRQTDADAAHLWSVIVNGASCIRNTVEIQHLIQENIPVYVPYCKPELGDDIPEPTLIDTYMYGTLLGHACLHYKQDKHMPLTLLQQAIVDGKYQIHGVNDSFEIPDTYLQLPIAQRAEIVKGLVEIMGWLDGDNTINIQLMVPSVKDFIVDTIRAMGGYASVLTVIDVFYIQIKHISEIAMFGIIYRAAGVAKPKITEDHIHLRITDVKYLGEVQTQCISIKDKDHLYITDNYIVTHNTALALMSVAHYKVRTALVMGATYIDTWMKSIGWTLGYTPKDVLVIRGRRALEDLIALRKEGNLTQKLIFFSISTLRSFTKDYNTSDADIDGVTPIGLMEFLGVGLRIVDEAHLMVHALTVDTIHTHVKRSIYLSATLVSADPFIEKQYLKLFPHKCRYRNAESNKHADAICVNYYFDDVEDVKYEGPRGYSHIMFEDYILEHPEKLTRYIEMIAGLVNDYYVTKRMPKMKCLVFCAKIDMCEAVTKGLLEHTAGSGLSISAYNSKHDPAVLYNNDIVVSTTKSAGTGKDIPNLFVCINTVAVGSIQLNQQTIGRLRPLKDYPKVSPQYLWLNCMDIPKHSQYSDKMTREHFVNRIRSITRVLINKAI